MTANDLDDLSSSRSDTIELDHVRPDVVADATVADVQAPAPLRARTRWGGIVWGLVLAALAAAGIWLVSAPGRAGDLVEGVRDVSAATAIGYGVAVIGGLLLVTGVVGLLRRAQRSLAARRGA